MSGGGTAAAVQEGITLALDLADDIASAIRGAADAAKRERRRVWALRSVWWPHHSVPVVELPQGFMAVPLLNAGWVAFNRAIGHREGKRADKLRSIRKRALEGEDWPEYAMAILPPNERDILRARVIATDAKGEALPGATWQPWRGQLDLAETLDWR